MTNANPFWKILLLAAVLFIGAVFALPNIFGSDLAVQIAGNKQPLPAESVDRAKAAIEAGGFNNVEFREENDRFVAIFQNQDEQLQAYDAVRNSIEQSTTTVALNLVSASPAWLRNISEPMYLGLDLRGGAHFLFEVDMDEAIRAFPSRGA